MKEVILQRAWFDGRATLGILSISGEDHDPIFTLENPLRATDIDSRIPSGTYECVPYSGTKHKDVYMIKDVPGRTAILIHTGNSEKDTEGCILVGLSSGVTSDEPMIYSSGAAMAFLKRIIGNESFKLTILERANA